MAIDLKKTAKYIQLGIILMIFQNCAHTTKTIYLVVIYLFKYISSSQLWKKGNIIENIKLLKILKNSSLCVHYTGGNKQKGLIASLEIVEVVERKLNFPIAESNGLKIFF